MNVKTVKILWVFNIDKILNRQECILKHIRQSKNISQSELSILSGVSLRSIQKNIYSFVKILYSWFFILKKDKSEVS